MSLLAVQIVVMGEDFFRESLFQVISQGPGTFFRGDDYEVIVAGMSNEIIDRPKIINHFPDQHGCKSENVIAGYKTIRFLKTVKMVETNINKCPTILVDYLAELVFNQLSRTAD